MPVALSRFTLPVQIKTYSPWGKPGTIRSNPPARRLQSDRIIGEAEYQSSAPYPKKPESELFDSPTARIFQELEMDKEGFSKISESLREKGYAILTANEATRSYFKAIIETGSLYGGSSGGNSPAQYHTYKLPTIFEKKIQQFVAKLLGPRFTTTMRILRWEKTGENRWHIDGKYLTMISALKGSGLDLIENKKDQDCSAFDYPNTLQDHYRFPNEADIERKISVQPYDFCIFLGSASDPEKGLPIVHRSPFEENRVILLSRSEE